jgi:hypothetical protein
MKRIAAYGAASAACIAVLFGLATLAFPGPAAREALLVAAAVAFFAQLLSFSLLALASTENLMTARAIGSLLRFVALVVFAIVVARGFNLPAAPALIGLAGYMFACTLLESLFLKT